MRLINYIIGYLIDYIVKLLSVGVRFDFLFGNVSQIVDYATLELRGELEIEVIYYIQTYMYI